MRIMIDNDKNLKKKLKLIEKFFLKKINLDENLFESGDLDSLKIIDLIIYIEKKTKKKISPNKINQESFNTLREILKIF